MRIRSEIVPIVVVVYHVTIVVFLSIIRYTKFHNFRNFCPGNFLTFFSSCFSLAETISDQIEKKIYPKFILKKENYSPGFRNDKSGKNKTILYLLNTVNKI